MEQFRTKKSYVFFEVGICGSPDLVTTVVAAVAKVESPTLGETVPGFAIILMTLFLFT